mmetsp:Transcript_44032/g.108100  ORF Transcript_44032/g.108100 Transcript_44032/m.108100 type:complete len:293 (+) Transcript_44032:904-1782(+)
MPSARSEVRIVSLVSLEMARPARTCLIRASAIPWVCPTSAALEQSQSAATMSAVSSMGSLANRGSMPPSLLRLTISAATRAAAPSEELRRFLVRLGSFITDMRSGATSVPSCSATLVQSGPMVLRSEVLARAPTSRRSQIMHKVKIQSASGAAAASSAESGPALATEIICCKIKLASPNWTSRLGCTESVKSFEVTRCGAVCRRASMEACNSRRLAATAAVSPSTADKTESLRVSIFSALGGLLSVKESDGRALATEAVPSRPWPIKKAKMSQPPRRPLGKEDSTRRRAYPS